MVVVGAGPCGLAAAIAARDWGLTSAVIERGCITESLIHYPWYMTFFSTAERLEIGGVPFTIPDPKPTRRQALAYYRHVVRHHRLSVRPYEEVTAVFSVAGGFEVRSAAVAEHAAGPERVTRARGVIVATGGFGAPNRLALDSGDELYDDRVTHYYRDPFPYFDLDVLVVGGGNSAVETALDLHRSGARTRMIHFGDKFDRGVKPWVLPDIKNRLAEGEIKMHWRSRVVGLGEGVAVLRCEETAGREEAEEKVVPNDRILAMTGWRPDTTLLRSLGVVLDPETGVPAHDPATMLTNVPGVYVAGVVAAGFDANKIFIENGRDHGALIAEHLSAALDRDLET